MALRRFGRVAVGTGRSPAAACTSGIRMMSSTLSDRERAMEVRYWVTPGIRVERLCHEIAKAMDSAARALTIRFPVNSNDDSLFSSKAYFNKQEEKLLRQLLKKVKTQAEEVDSKEAKKTRETERTRLMDIVGKYKMSHEDIEALIEWRHDPTV